MQINQFPEALSANNTDNLTIQTAEGITKKISRAKFLEGISSGSGSGSSSLIFDAIVNSDYVVTTEKRLIIDASVDVTITLPETIAPKQQIDFLVVDNRPVKKVLINAPNSNFKSNPVAIDNLIDINAREKLCSLVYVDSNKGYIPSSQSDFTHQGILSPGYLLLLNGSLSDQSGGSRNATNSGSKNVDLIATATDNQPALSWDGSGTQELSVSPFLSGTTGATVYVVYEPTANQNYNLIQTTSQDDYWYFTGNGSGYFGTFRSGRFEGYPTSMPSSGLHLASVHVGNFVVNNSNTGSYEVTLNSASKGKYNGAYYTPGSIFKIANTGKPFKGRIYSVLCYGSLIDPSSESHLINLKYFKSRYPSLPFTV